MVSEVNAVESLEVASVVKASVLTVMRGAWSSRSDRLEASAVGGDATTVVDIPAPGEVASCPHRKASFSLSRKMLSHM